MAKTHISDTWIRTIDSGNGTQYTFCGALEYRYKHIATYWNDATRRKYDREYDDIILPALDNHDIKTIADYTKEDYKNAIERIRENGYERNGVKRQYAESTIRHFQILIYYVVFQSWVVGLCEDVLWGTTFAIDRIGEEQEKESRVQIKKSLSSAQEKRLSKELLSNLDEDGARIALLLMWGLGLRNAEACGLNYGDIKPIEGHPYCFAAWIYKTTKIESNELQSSGKTYNTGRIVPVPERIMYFLSERKEKIESIISEQGLAGLNIENLPICNQGLLDYESDGYLKRCEAKDVTKIAPLVFENAGISSEQVAYLDSELSQDNTSLILKEKDATAYLLRRNYATQMSILGLTNAEMQYLMGHSVEDAYESRNEFVDSGRIYTMYLKLQRRRILNFIEDNNNEAWITIPNKSTVKITASALEPTDNLNVRVTSKDPEGVQTRWFEDSPNGAFDRTVNILEQYNSRN